ncbi:RNA polymerase subunit sigma-70 [Xenorhabdus stockiae]|uniref:RNA polymerase subunit sigma-70 n=1 Tax=Xenorhabdus stockiae TaxID=351614 RepID=UPI003CF798BC
MKTLSISKYAEHAGVTRQTIYDWAKQETFPPRVGKYINVEAADAWRRQYIDSTDPRTENAKKAHYAEAESLEVRAKVVYDELHGGNVQVRPLEESRAIKEHYLAELVKLEHSIKSGEVLPWRDMVNKVGEEYSRLRTRLIAIAPEHGPRLRALATTSTDTEFVAALQEIIYEAMYELSVDSKSSLA